MDKNRRNKSKLDATGIVYVVNVGFLFCGFCCFLSGEFGAKQAIDQAGPSRRMQEKEGKKRKH